REKRGNALIELRARRIVELDVMRGAPMQVSVGVIVDEARRAAARERQHEQKYVSELYQKLSTVMWPGVRRRCLRIPRATSAAVASRSICGLPQSMTWAVSGASLRPAAFSRRPSAIAAGMRPASEPAAFSRLTKLT